MSARVVRFIAVATAATALAACSSPGQSGALSSSSAGVSSSSAGDVSASSSVAAGGSTTSAAAVPSSPTAQQSGSDGCGKPHGPFAEPGAPMGSVTTGSAELAASWNNQTSHGNSTYDANPQYLTQAQIFYYDKSLNVVNNDQFITCVVTSKNPLTVKYTLNKDAKWSDGVPVTADDLLLQWIAQSGKFSTGTLKTDKDGIPIGSTGVAFDTASPGMALIPDFPEMTANGKTMTVTYSKPFVDFALNFGSSLLPAHVVGQKALGIADPAKADAAIVAAAKSNDKAALKKIADFWNTGFDFTALPSDKSLYLSSGAYLLTDFKKDQYMTFTANPDYTWGPKPSVKTIIYQFLPDATAAVQALQNGEVQIVDPEHPTASFSKGLAGLAGQGIKAVTSISGSWEHVDLVFDNGGPFDPKTYGGDAAKANDVREAFLKTVPRQAILARLIKPLDPNAALRDSFNVVPGAPGYQQIAADNGLKAFDQVDIGGAKALLAKAGVSSLRVRLLYSATNPVRGQEYQLMAQSAAQAGITLVDAKDPNWASNLPNISRYDASLFGWQNTNLGIAQVPPNFLGKNGGQWTGQNNYGHYNNEAVNKEMNTLNETSDPATQAKLLRELEKNLVADNFGTVLYQFPDIVGFDSNKVTNVSSIPVSPQVFWNFWEWKLAG